MKRLAFAIALFVPAVHAMPPQLIAKIRGSASVMAWECAPDRHDEFVDRFERITVEILGPPIDDHLAKVVRSRAALEKARADYLGCIKAAREQDLAPKDACAAQGEHFREREATVRALVSRDILEAMTFKNAPELARAMQAMASDYPGCDFRKLKVIPR